MKVVRVGDVAQQVRGVTFAKSDARTTPGPGLKFVLRAGNIQDGQLTPDDLVYVPASMIALRQYVQANDVVIATSSGSLDVVGKAARATGPLDGGFGAFLKVLRPGPDVDPGYFANYFQTPAYRRKVSALAAGANINNLKNEHLDNLSLPLPPIGEQRRIAAILDQADAVRAKRRQILTYLDRLRPALFRQRFASGSYQRAPLGDLLASFQAGLDRRAAAQGPTRAFDYVKMDAITNCGELDLTRVRRVDASPAEVAKFSLADGDLILNTRNTRDLVGKSAVYRGPNCLYNNNVARIRTGPTLTPAYLHGYLWSQEGQRALDACKSGTTSVFAVYAKSLMALLVPVPPIEEQATYCAQLEAIDEQRNRMPAASGPVDDLFTALQARAFCGSCDAVTGKREESGA